MSRSSKVKEMLISSLGELSGNLSMISEKYGADKPIVKEKVFLLQRKIEVLMASAKGSKISHYEVPDVLELCDFFKITADGTIEGCKVDEVVEHLRKFSSKFAAVFEMISFEDWNLLLESRSTDGLSITPAPESFVQQPSSVISVKSTDECDNNSIVGAAPKSKEPAFRHKKPVVLFNPGATKAKRSPAGDARENKTDTGNSSFSPSKSVPGTTSQHSTPNASESSSNIATSILPPRLASKSFSEGQPPVLNFSQPNVVPQPSSEPSVNPANVVVKEMLKKAVLASGPLQISQTVQPSGVSQPIIPQPLPFPQIALSMVTNQTASVPLSSPALQPFPQPQQMFFPNAVPFQPTVVQGPGDAFPTVVSSIQLPQLQKRKAIKITNPSTGEEVKFDKNKSEQAQSAGSDQIDKQVGVALDSLVFVVEEEQNKGDVVFGVPEQINTLSFTDDRPLSAASESKKKQEPISFTGPKSAGPPPGFSKPVTKKEEDSNFLIEQVNQCMQTKSSSSRTGKPVKTEKVFAAFQKMAGDAAIKTSLDEFIKLLKSHPAVFRLSAHGSQVELMSTINNKILYFAVSELLKVPISIRKVAIQQLYDAYVAAMKDANRVLHVGPKYSLQEFTDTLSRADGVISMSTDDETACHVAAALYDEVYVFVTKLLQEGAKDGGCEMSPAGLFAKFQESVVNKDRLSIIVQFDVFIELLTRCPETFKFVDSRVSLATAFSTSKRSQSHPYYADLLITSTTTTTGFGDIDDYSNFDENCGHNNLVELAGKVTSMLPFERGNAVETKEFIREFNSATNSFLTRTTDEQPTLPVRPLPDALPYDGNDNFLFFRGIVSNVLSENNRIFLSFPLSPVCLVFSSARDLADDEDFTAYAKVAIFGPKRKTAEHWCSVGKLVVFYRTEEKTYARGVIIKITTEHHCGNNDNLSFVESLTVLDVDSGDICEQIAVRNVAPLTKFYDIPSLAVRCSYVLEPGAVLPKKKSLINFMLDTQTLFSSKVNSQSAFFKDYSTGVLPLPIIILAPTSS